MPTTVVVLVAVTKLATMVAFSPLSSISGTESILSHYPRHLGLIPSTVEESTPIVPSATPMTTTMAAPMAMVVPTATEAPISMPDLPSLVDQ